jgi:hypothetical protein
MARKIDPNASATPPTDDPGEDLAIVQPDQELELAGCKVTVLEYRFVDGLRVRAKAKALVADLRSLVESGEALTEDVLDVLATHGTLVRELMAEATDGADADWIDSLSADDGETLLLTWWAVNGPFFMRQIVRRLAEKAVFEAQLNGSAGPTSSIGSSRPATAGPMNSSASPSVN